MLVRFRDAGLKLNMSKCQFKKSSVTFLGHTVSGQGIQPSADKVKAVQEAKTPTSKAEIRSVLGLVTYLGRFCPRLAEVTKPMRDVIKKEVNFFWEAPQENAFNQLKTLVSNAPVLALFDPEKETVLNVDASSHSIGAVLLQDEKPIEYAAQSLTPTQCMYAQIEKMLDIQFGLTHFHQYVYGREVTVESDHQPLVRVTQKPLGDLSPRLQRMKMNTQRYQYKVVHVPGKHMYLSDYLSRSCKEGTIVEKLDIGEPMDQVCSLVIRSTEAKHTYIEATSQDSILQVVLNYTKTGWPKQKRLCNPLANPFWVHRTNITVHEGLLFLGERLIIPYSRQAGILDKLHEGHQGICKTQQRAKTAVFWPGINNQIEDRIAACATCKTHDRAQTRAPLTPSEIPEYPWQTIGSDLFQVKGQHYLLNVDYYSKWVNVVQLTELTSNAVIKEFRKQFADYGQVQIIRSDNGPQYSSKDFREFISEFSIRHDTSSPGYPRSNGLAERAVQTVKSMIVKALEDGGCIWKALQHFRNTPLGPRLLSPAQLLQGRNLYDGLPVKTHCLFPRAYDRESTRSEFSKRQDIMKANHDNKCSLEKPVLQPGQNVRFRTLQGKWERAVIVNHHASNKSYNITNDRTGINIRRNRQDNRSDNTPNETQKSKESVSIPINQHSRISTNKPETSQQPQVQYSSVSGTPVKPSLSPVHDTPSTCRENTGSSRSPSTAYTTSRGRVINKPLRYRM